MIQEKIIQQGAEAIIIKSNDFVIKDRIKKSYRLPELDEKIRKRRTRSETKLLHKAHQLISVPLPLIIPKKSERGYERAIIKMPFIKGKKLSDYLDKFPLKKQKQICKKIGESVAKLHDSDIIHGDLTTSNMILVEDKKNLPAHPRSQIDKNSINKKYRPNPISQKSSSTLITSKKSSDSEQIFFIDFGLGFISHKLEDKAVDLHLLRQALEAKHFKNWEVLFEEVLKEYNKSKDSRIILERLRAVEKRGRYKH